MHDTKHQQKTSAHANQVRWQLLILVMLIIGGTASALANGIEITVQTTECSGDIGFSAFDSDALYKIQSSHCNDPSTGKKLQQVLIKAAPGVTQYNVLSVTEEEARSIMQQIKEYKAAKIKRMTRPTVVIEKDITIEQK